MALVLGLVGCASPTGQATPVSNVPTLAVSPTPSSASTPWPTTLPGAASCRPVTPIGVTADGLPPINAEDWVRGPADAPITLIEYADFE